MDRPILVVDDDAAIRDMLAEILTDEGYRTAAAGDGAEALELLRAGLEPGLIVLDLMMPRVSGQEFRVRQCSDPQLSAIPVIVLSAFPHGEVIASALAPAAYLPKPVNLNQLLHVVAQSYRAA